MKAIFFSDAHLNERDHDRQERLVEFLGSIGEIDRLYIVGDLFDFWFGYRTVVFRYFIPVITRLFELYRQGCELVYVLGNHDFYLGPLFEDTIPMRLIPDSAAEEIDGQRLFLIHGDGIDKSDRGYRILRFVVRGRLVRFVFQWIHPDLGWKLARFLSKSSRSYTTWRGFDREKAYQEFGRDRIRDGVDLCVIAHSHMPFDRLFQGRDGRSGRIINLGDWIDHRTYLRYESGEGFALRRYLGEGKSEIIPPVTMIPLEEATHGAD